MTPATTGKDSGDMPTLAPLRERLGELASRNIFVGTSSWKYEGWLGQLYSPERYEYRDKIAKTRFEAECLSEYAETFRTVCVDAGFYRFPDEKYIANLASKVPDGFLLSFKATDEITIKHFPNQQRHGERAGKPNENFLNAELFADSFLGPMSPYREKIGVIMSKIQRDIIARGVFESRADLARKIMRYIRHYNKAAVPFRWSYQNTAKRIR